ncbi:uncharacterized protein LOC116289030 [Actinia tenebrosa]|uniref:Uncharacterized protein LOC116289030 n=1 Tax=Actinia tenebrosa TaxID=6105 RepID=A0A6P8HGR3_ACTTE|nr:uncharacterized protein LOC116289030 [Actinia tenebrosa]XP_031551766.1 uncharacterized protein LOC116289030 [Actinia tenebrosa]
MEMLAFRNCMGALSAWSLAIGTLITDRHISITKYMRERLSHITHYFDLWHLKKKIHKVLTKISKEKGCEVLNQWIKPCQNHLVWSATSTPSGNGQLIWAKFKSYLSHIVNKHKDLDETIFNRCSHGDIPQRQWLEEDTPVYDKVRTALTKASLVKGIKKASPVCQTSCLEGFHSVVNQYCPKMIGYSYQGMYCRHIIAATHFNHNLQRKVKTSEDGSEKVTIVYPKFRNGEATVRSVRVQPNYDYIDRVYDTFIEAQSQKNLLGALEELNAVTPAPMHTMLEKQSRQDAVTLWKKRKSMVVQEVPGTALNEAERAQGSTRAVENTTTRAQPQCRICKNPMKNHKNVKDCPKNRKP